MTSLRRPAALALLALAAGCIRIPTEPTRSVHAEVRVTTTSRGAADSVRVDAFFVPLDGGSRIAFRSDTLRVQNVLGSRTGGREPSFAARVPLDSAAVAGGVRVRLPVPTLGAVPHSEFTLFSAARRGSPAVTLRAGQDLLLPVVRGAPGTLPAPAFEQWSVSFSRGGHNTNISGNGPLPSPVVVPWALIPREGANTMQVLVTYIRHFRVEGPGSTGGATRLVTSVTAEAVLEWSVTIVP